MSTRREVAEFLLDQGLPLLPLIPGKKRPRVKWKNGQNRITKPSQLNGSDDDYGALIVPPYLGIDLDVEHRGTDVSGIASFAKLLDGNQLPKTLRTKTAGGGRHYWFRIPDGSDFKGPIDLADEQGIEIYTDHRQFVTVRDGYDVALDKIVDAPLWLLEILESLRNQPGRSDTSGGRNNILSNRAFGLRRDGQSIESIYAAISTLNKEFDPPLPDNEVWEIARKKENIGADEWILKFNERYIALGLASFRIGEFVQDRDNGFEELKLYTPSSLAQNYRQFANPSFPHKSNPVTKWMDSPLRRSANGICFEPGQGAIYQNKLNRFQGWWIQPSEEGSCDLFLKHIIDNVALGDHGHFSWIISWFAEQRQRPTLQRAVSLSLRSGQGLGKSVIFDVMGRTLWPHYLSVGSRDEVIGRFNGHLENVILLVADEAIFAKDPTVSAALKSLTASKTRKIERKGADIYHVNNYIHLGIASNSELVVPADMDDRRYAVFDVVDNGQRNDANGYFTKMFEELERDSGSGYRALARVLDNWELVDLRRIPGTKARSDQKMASGDSHVQFLYEFIDNGKIDGVCDEWPKYVTCTEFQEAYEFFAKRHGDRFPLIPSQLGKQLRRLIPGIRKARPRIVKNGPQVPCYQIPSQILARKQFAKSSDSKVQDIFRRIPSADKDSNLPQDPGTVRYITKEAAIEATRLKAREMTRRPKKYQKKEESTDGD